MTVTLPAAITPSPAFQPVPGQRIDPELEIGRAHV